MLCSFPTCVTVVRTQLSAYDTGIKSVPDPGARESPDPPSDPVLGRENPPCLKRIVMR